MGQVGGEVVTESLSWGKPLDAKLYDGTTSDYNTEALYNYKQD